MAEFPDRKAELIAQLDAQRVQLSASARGLRRSADVGARVKASILQSRAVWFGGAALLGLLLTRLRRPRQVFVDRQSGKKIQAAERTGLLLAVAKIAFDLARPTLLRWASGKVSETLAQHLARQGGKPR